MLLCYPSLVLGLRAGSLDKKPKINSEMKNITTVYTKIFNVSICERLKQNQTTNKL